MPVFDRNASFPGPSTQTEELSLVLTAVLLLASVFGSGLRSWQWGGLCAVSRMKFRFLCVWQWLLGCAKAMRKISSVTTRCLMSHYILFTEEGSYPGKSGGCHANGTIWLLLGSMLRTHKNSLDVESRHEECVLLRLVKNKCTETGITEQEQDSSERGEKRTVKDQGQHWKNDYTL